MQSLTLSQVSFSSVRTLRHTLNKCKDLLQLAQPMPAAPFRQCSPISPFDHLTQPGIRANLFRLEEPWTHLSSAPPDHLQFNAPGFSCPSPSAVQSRCCPDELFPTANLLALPGLETVDQTAPTANLHFAEAPQWQQSPSLGGSSPLSAGLSPSQDLVIRGHEKSVHRHRQNESSEKVRRKKGGREKGYRYPPEKQAKVAQQRKDGSCWRCTHTRGPVSSPRDSKGPFE